MRCNDPIYPVIRQPGWQSKAACKGLDPNDFIPEKKHPKDTIHYDRTVCDNCIVKAQCLDYALANRAEKGLWGGTSPKERESMYNRYQGERTDELDLNRILFPRGIGSRNISMADDPPEDTDNIVQFPVAPDSDIYFSWFKEIFVQGTLF